jgi:hypothetical protein
VTFEEALQSSVSSTVTRSLSLGHSLTFDLDISWLKMGPLALHMDSTRNRSATTSSSVTIRESTPVSVNPGEKKRVMLSASTTEYEADFTQRVCLTDHVWCQWDEMVDGHHWYVIGNYPQDLLCGSLRGLLKAQVYDSKGTITMTDIQASPSVVRSGYLRTE